MPQARELEKFINELNERICALEMIQRVVVAVMAGRSEVEKDLLKDGVESFINELPPEAARSTIKKILNSYLNLINGHPSGGGFPALRLIPGEKD